MGRGGAQKPEGGMPMGTVHQQGRVCVEMGAQTPFPQKRGSDGQRRGGPGMGWSGKQEGWSYGGRGRADIRGGECKGGGCQEMGSAKAGVMKGGRHGMGEGGEETEGRAAEKGRCHGSSFPPFCAPPCAAHHPLPPLFRSLSHLRPP